MTKNGTAIAMTVAGLLVAAAPQVGHAGDKSASDAKVRCGGVNDCKGQSACSTDSNACSGQNSCRGKGWIVASAKECKDKKGTNLDEAPPPAPAKKKK
jgi:hypothetical protein